MTDILKLYRGDASKIGEFKYSMTSKHCLLGQGIYLSDKVTVAETYRTKGTYSRSTYEPLYNGIAATKGEAMAGALENYVDSMYKKQHGKAPANSKTRDSFKEIVRYAFFKLVDEDRLVVKKSAILRNNKEYRWVIEIDGEEKDGYLTSFEFPKAMLLNNVIDVDKRTLDVGFLEIVYESRLLHRQIEKKAIRYTKVPPSRLNDTKGVHYTADELDSFPAFRKVIGLASFPCGSWMNGLIPHLKPYGILGFKYNGGVRLGGAGFHSAFSLWDEEFVNQHKVSRRR